ncbi:N-6 DNA methylase [bacterium]|nr:N-6 DNA methylase [bacterium]
MNTLDLNKTNELSIGAIFTPQNLANFAIKEFNLFDKWINGATIFDPTMGEGNLLEAFINLGFRKGINPKELPIQNLYGVELNSKYYNNFLNKIQKQYNLILPQNNFINKDIFFLHKEFSFDIIFGNPPWQNFVDLPDLYKQKIKSQFFKYDLIGNSQDLLLGGSRIDLAALVIQKTIEQNLKKNGEAIFFMPLSLLLNDGANKYFRTYKVNSTPYLISKIFDFNDTNAFDGVATRYGLVHFLRDKKQTFPIPYSRCENKKWINYFAKPMFHFTDPLSIFSDLEINPLESFEPITLKKDSVPRQGINTCGANDIFFFDTYEEIDELTCLVANKTIKKTPLPKKYLFPLATSINFREEKKNPLKWALLPYNSNGKVLELTQILKEQKLAEFLFNHKIILQNRKGLMLNALISRGNWWSLLGVGAYNFYPYKIIWEAYGKTKFCPQIFQKDWQANQSLQAFIPLKSLNEAEKILELLLDKRIENYLLSLKMEGTMNWAQPGKIKKFLAFENETLSLF